MCGGSVASADGLIDRIDEARAYVHRFGLSKKDEVWLWGLTLWQLEHLSSIPYVATSQPTSNVGYLSERQADGRERIHSQR